MQAFSTQSFSTALKDGTAAPPDGLTGPVTKRFAIYRNNVAVGLIRALETSFPAVMDLVGDEFFRAMARDFIAAHPPRSPVLMRFGSEFADFVAGFEPAHQFPYLADIVRIEMARRDAYHAADTPRLEAQAFAGIAPEQLADLRFTLHPAVHIVRSNHPAFTIFGMSTGTIAAGPFADWIEEDCLIDRLDYDPTIRLLPPGGAAFLASLQSGEALAGAAMLASEEPGFDLSANLAMLIGDRLAVNFTISPQDHPA